MRSGEGTVAFSHTIVCSYDNGLDLCGASMPPMSKEDCLRVFPYWTKTVSFGQYLWSRLMVHISCRKTSQHYWVSSPQPIPVSSWLFGLHSFHPVTLPCPANWLTVSQPVTVWKTGNVESLGSWCVKWRRSICTSVSLQTTRSCPHANLTEPVGCAYGQRTCRKPLERSWVFSRNIVWGPFRTDFPRACVRPPTGPGNQ